MPPKHSARQPGNQPRHPAMKTVGKHTAVDQSDVVPSTTLVVSNPAASAAPQALAAPDSAVPKFPHSNASVAPVRNPTPENLAFHVLGFGLRMTPPKTEPERAARQDYFHIKESKANKGLFTVTLHPEAINANLAADGLAEEDKRKILALQGAVYSWSGYEFTPVIPGTSHAYKVCVGAVTDTDSGPTTMGLPPLFRVQFGGASFRTRLFFDPHTQTEKVLYSIGEWCGELGDLYDCKVANDVSMTEFLMKLGGIEYYANYIADIAQDESVKVTGMLAGLEEFISRNNERLSPLRDSISGALKAVSDAGEALRAAANAAFTQPARYKDSCKNAKPQGVKAIKSCEPELVALRKSFVAFMAAIDSMYAEVSSFNDTCVSVTGEPPAAVNAFVEGNFSSGREFGGYFEASLSLIDGTLARSHPNHTHVFTLVSGRKNVTVQFWDELILYSGSIPHYATTKPLNLLFPRFAGDVSQVFSVAGPTAYPGIYATPFVDSETANAILAKGYVRDCLQPCPDGTLVPEMMYGGESVLSYDGSVLYESPAARWRMLVTQNKPEVLQSLGDVWKRILSGTGRVGSATVPLDFLIGTERNLCDEFPRELIESYIQYNYQLACGGTTTHFGLFEMEDLNPVDEPLRPVESFRAAWDAPLAFTSVSYSYSVRLFGLMGGLFSYAVSPHFKADVEFAVARIPAVVDVFYDAICVQKVRQPFDVLWNPSVYRLGTPTAKGDDDKLRKLISGVEVKGDELEKKINLAKALAASPALLAKAVRAI